ncbi:MAG: efflux RND transporter periplasmic adaptor subunit [gamma proteobacterium symbiont of Ctena orbiculata]|nr:MAG: efflux RND transporter periplasmic adaptor subunit [gamma proteobacterium symbiont of Ctena orbiculata]PUB89117.1 MAG: efflux RND transporter periplasmic adaptor subunit [gamma proteobacterium symbiont of Ctena orbiculata]
MKSYHCFSCQGHMNIPQKNRRQTRPFVLRRCLVLMAFICGNLAFAQQSGPMVLVDSAEEVALIEEVPITGSVISARIAKLSTEVSGIVERISIEIGDQVRTGDEILQLNSELDRLSLAAARAATESAIQELEDAKRRLNDAKVLAKRHSVSVNEIESLAAEVRIDSAGVKRFQAEQQRQAAQLKRHKLIAPFAGVISRRLVEQGEWIQPGDTVVELIATEGLRIDFRVPQSVYAKLDKTTKILISLDALPGRTFDGVIETIIPVTDPGTRTFLVRATLDDHQAKLAPGMSASAVLRLNTGTRGVVIHRDALIRYPDGRVTVWAVNQKGESATVSEQQVQTGLSFNGMVTITSGLAADTTVVVQGNEALRDGQNVIIKREE